MDTNEPTDGGRSVWPPPPTQEPPTIIVRPPPELSEGWVWGQVFGRMLLLGLAFGAVGGAGFGGVLMQGTGFVAGLVFGAIAGLLLGFLEGLVLASMTCAVFLPLDSAAGYRRTIGILTVALTLVGAPLLSGSLLGGWQANWFTLVPAVIATLAAWAASQLIARWYAAASGKS